MFRAPPPHTLGVMGVAPVVLVLQFGQPELLAVRFAGSLTVRGRAEPLVVPVVGISSKQLLTMPALTTTSSHAHEERCSLPEPNPENKSGGEESDHRRTRTAKKEEGFESKSWKKTDPRRWVPFKPRESGSFRSAHDKCHARRERGPKSAV